MPKNPKRATKEDDEFVQVVISKVPSQLVADIDGLAGENDRTRAAEARQLIIEAIAQRRRLKQKAA